MPLPWGRGCDTVRGLRGLSLMQVERESAGRFKAIVVGSYERGDRAVTVSRLAELAEFYGVPTQDLLPADTGARSRPLPAPGTANSRSICRDCSRYPPGRRARWLATPWPFSSSEARRAPGF